MPNGIYPAPPIKTRKDTGHRSPTSRPGIGLRLRTWWRRPRLDEQLAEGSDPSTSPELALRANQLRSDEERVRLAKALEAVVREVSGPPTINSLLARRRHVYACADEMLLLAQRLRNARPIAVRGAAMTAALLFDLRSPLYYQLAGVPTPEAVRSARLALDELTQSDAPGARRRNGREDHQRRRGVLKAVDAR